VLWLFTCLCVYEFTPLRGCLRVYEFMWLFTCLRVYVFMCLYVYVVVYNHLNLYIHLTVKFVMHMLLHTYCVIWPVHCVLAIHSILTRMGSSAEMPGYKLGNLPLKGHMLLHTYCVGYVQSACTPLRWVKKSWHFCFSQTFLILGLGFLGLFLIS